jgi:hypothetical protein
MRSIRGSGSGSGTGTGFGFGYGYGFGSGDGDGYGYGYGDPVGRCGEHAATMARPWQVLRIGCEVHTIAEWIRDADEIDKKHGDGIADQTRALAIELKGTA